MVVTGFVKRWAVTEEGAAVWLEQSNRVVVKVMEGTGELTDLWLGARARGDVCWIKGM